ncbi:MAG: hypothetical protein CEN90_101 [Parcubacteria group bacterium Licking1014_17]|nr:MAG: hypothetical protein CEN90_101 [Parcubacteria group bacterium Licking1014_17]
MDTINYATKFAVDTVYLAFGEQNVRTFVKFWSVAIEKLPPVIIFLFALTLFSHVIYMVSLKLPLYKYPGYIIGKIARFLHIAPWRKPWGIVYDSVTKKPVVGAQVEILNKDFHILETRNTDELGRYAFLVGQETLVNEELIFKINVIKDGYKFPSSRVTSHKDTYNIKDVYLGEFLTHNPKLLVNFNIPLDPSGVEIKPEKTLLRGVSLKTIQILLLLGSLLYIVYFPYDTSIKNIIFAIILFCVGLYASGDKKDNHLFYGFTLDKNRSPLPHTLLILKSESGMQAGIATSDSQGRFFMLTKPGKYILHAKTPGGVQPFRQAELTVKTGDGWIAPTVSL